MSELPKEIQSLTESDSSPNFIGDENKTPIGLIYTKDDENEIIHRYNTYPQVVEALKQAEKVIEAQEAYLDCYRLVAKTPAEKHFAVLKEYQRNNKIEIALKAAGGDDGLGS